MEDKAYNKVTSRTSRERSAERAVQAYTSTPEGRTMLNLMNELNLLRQRTAILESKLNELQGQNGIEVKLPYISFVGKGGGLSGNTSRVWAMLQTGATTVDFEIIEAYTRG